MGLPSPFEELSVGSSVHEAVLFVHSERACFVAVVRFFRIKSPVSGKYVASLCFFGLQATGIYLGK